MTRPAEPPPVIRTQAAYELCRVLALELQESGALPPEIGGAFVTLASEVMIVAIGTAATADWLGEVADGVRAFAPQLNPSR